jgi:hypothetical protein
MATPRQPSSGFHFQRALRCQQLGVSCFLEHRKRSNIFSMIIAPSPLFSILPLRSIHNSGAIPLLTWESAKTFASGGEIMGDSFVQQNPQWVAKRIPTLRQDGHSRYSGSGPNASKLISYFQCSLSRSVVPEGSPVLTCASRDISQAIKP